MTLGCRSRRSHRALSAVCAAVAVTAMAVLPGVLFRDAATAQCTPVRASATAGHPAAAGTLPVHDAGQDPASRAGAA
jgi:hypothetical protein